MSFLLQFRAGPRRGPAGALALASTLTGLLALAGPLPALAAPAGGRPAVTSRRTPQDVSVSGRVTTPAGEGLPGVSVVVKGTSIGTSTNADGQYTLSVPENSTLVFSYVGYLAQERAVGSQSVIDVTLAVDQQKLNEVVVVGYGTQTRQELTTAVSSVGAAQLGRQTVAGLDQALQGQTAGVQVTSPSGAPGSGINVQVRGSNSISLTNSPLYVIDGVPVLPTYDQEVGVGNQRANPLNAINPQDIERIDVLKDGAAAAIYGLRAANGVVVITTKRGKTGKAEVGLSVYGGQQELRKKIDLLNGEQFASYYNEARVNAGQPVAFMPGAAVANTDWQDLVYRKATIQNYQVSLRGGTENTKYYASGGYFKQEGIIRNSGFERYSFKLNLDQNISTRVRFGTSLNLSRTNNNRSPSGETRLENGGAIIGAQAQIPTIVAVLPDGTYGTNPFTPTDNPYGALLETRNLAAINQVIGNLYGEADVLKGLTYRTNVGLDYRGQLENQYQTRQLPAFQSVASSARGRAQVGNQQQLIWLWENTLTYRPTLGNKHDLTLLAGQSIQESDRQTSGGSSSGFSSDAAPYLGNGSIPGAPYSYQDQWALTSLFARAIYNYDERYLFTVSLRRDGTSRFAPSNRYGYFPAVSAGWRLSKESFFPQAGPVSNLKLRASYGANGNQEITPYGRFSTYSGGYLYPGIGDGGALIGGIAPQNIGNNNLQWERTNQYNLGLDLGFLSDRLTLTVDAYNKRTNRLLTSVPLAVSVGIDPDGFGTVLRNIGTVENRGLEFGFNSVNLPGADGGFSWTTNLNLSLNRNKVISLDGTTSEQGVEEIISNNGYTTTRVGSPLGAFYGYQTQGIFQTTAEVTGAATQANAKPGDIRFRDVNGDGKITAADRVIIGNPNPKAIAGVTNTFGFKGVELSVFFQGSFGNDLYNQNRVTLEGEAGPFNQTTAVLNRWTPTNTNTDIPRAVVGDPNKNANFSNRFVEDGSYVRLKNLTLAYNLPAGLLTPAHIGGIRVFVTGQNLITWTDYSGYDPEVSADPFSSVGFGRDLGVYPQARTYTVGLNASF